MCSIFGYCNNKYSRIEEVFYNAMRHRGPDAEKHISIDGFVLGHQRLSIIDTNDRANQPMRAGNDVIILNGEIYNYIELKKKYLNDIAFRTSSDTEVLLELLRNEGIAILNRLNGMFAFGWYNNKDNKLYLCRDRYGVKPLYWMKDAGSFYFSSEMRPLIKIKKSIEFNKNSVDAFIKDTATDYNENTFIDGIFQVRPGCYLTLDADCNVKENIWYIWNDYKVDEGIFKDSIATIDYFEEILTDSIRLRHRSDVPICITLSGGLDSTTIYTLSKEKLQSHIKPFTFIHPGSNTSELPKVEKLVREYNDIVCCVESDHSNGIDDLKEAFYFLEFPIWNPSAIAYLDMYKVIHNSGFTVVIEGHGSDEQLGGYPYMIRSAVFEYIYKGRLGKAYEIYKIYQQTNNPALNQQLKGSILYNYLRLIASSIKNRKIHSRRYQDIVDESFNYKILPIVLRSFDRLTMSQSIESRSPFMDYRVVELIKALPFKYKVSSLGSKSILRNILRKYNKDYIYSDKKKMGFAADLPSFYNEPENKLFFSKYVNKFNLDGYDEIKRRAQQNIKNTNILWSDTESIWKTASIAMIQEMYNAYEYI